jgi:hypothetical protein
MNWDAVGAIGEWVGAISVVVTLAYLARQMRLHTRQLRRSEQNTTMEQFSKLRLAVAQDAELARLLLTAETDFASLDAVGRYRVERYVLDWIFANYNFWDRVQKGDVDGEWEEVEPAVARWLQTSVGRELWPGYRVGVRPEFREALDRLVTRPPSA